jgi:hypothetical protein
MTGMRKVPANSAVERDAIVPALRTSARAPHRER